MSSTVTFLHIPSSVLGGKICRNHVGVRNDGNAGGQRKEVSVMWSFVDFKRNIIHQYTWRSQRTIEWKNGRYRNTGRKLFHERLQSNSWSNLVWSEKFWDFRSSVWWPYSHTSQRSPREEKTEYKYEWEKRMESNNDLYKWRRLSTGWKA